VVVTVLEDFDHDARRHVGEGDEGTFLGSKVCRVSSNATLMGAEENRPEANLGVICGAKKE
jgi:hypothetical protein